MGTCVAAFSRTSRPEDRATHSTAPGHVPPQNILPGGWQILWPKANPQRCPAVLPPSRGQELLLLYTPGLEPLSATCITDHDTEAPGGPPETSALSFATLLGWRPGIEILKNTARASSTVEPGLPEKPLCPLEAHLRPKKPLLSHKYSEPLANRTSVASAPQLPQSFPTLLVPQEVQLFARKSLE